MRIHNFIESAGEDYKRCIFCTRCGQVAWYYNISLEANKKLQTEIKLCVESGDTLLTQ